MAGTRPLSPTVLVSCVLHCRLCGPVCANCSQCAVSAVWPSNRVTKTHITNTSAMGALVEYTGVVTVTSGVSSVLYVCVISTG